MMNLQLILKTRYLLKQISKRILLIGLKSTQTLPVDLELRMEEFYIQRDKWKDIHLKKVLQMQFNANHLNGI